MLFSAPQSVYGRPDSQYGELAKFRDRRCDPSMMLDHVVVTTLKIMTGDAAGMITPLCGNGMAMAIHSCKILSDLILSSNKTTFDRAKLEQQYSNAWKNLFERRLWAGRQIQNLFGGEWTSNVAVNLARYSKPVARFLVDQTHGKPF
jgi:flavin-dependent dehydrogenase